MHLLKSNFKWSLNYHSSNLSLNLFVLLLPNVTQVVTTGLSLCGIVGSNRLFLKTNKTRWLWILGWPGISQNTVSTVSFLGEEVEVAKEYRYLVDYQDSRLDWKSSIEVVYKKGQKSWYLLKKLRSFNICTKMFHIFCWGEYNLFCRIKETEQTD